MKGMNKMWWKVKKIYEDKEKVIYSYSNQSNILDGEIECNKVTEKFKCNKLSKNDTEKSIERFYTHLWRLIFEENAPDEKKIAIG